MTNELLRNLDEICARGRVFSETFPGTAASDEWRAAFIRTHPGHVRADDAAATAPRQTGAPATIPGESRGLSHAGADK